MLQHFMEGGGRAEWSFIRFGSQSTPRRRVLDRLAKDIGFVNDLHAVNTQRFYGREEMNISGKIKDYSIKRYKPETYIYQNWEQIN